MRDGRRRLNRRLRRVGRQARRRTDLSNILSAAWAVRALNKLRKDLPRVGTSAVVRQPPRSARAGQAGIEAVLRRRKATCLERCLILQSWLASQGRRHEVVIGVGAPGEDFAAHAWLADYGFDPQSLRYKELMRLPAPYDRSRGSG